ncbi:MAG: radical SAM protein [Methanoregula sp.]|nr:radical SAM protein [Methanoregula sp.]
MKKITEHESHIDKNVCDISFIVSPTNVNSEYMPFYFLYLAGFLEKEGYKCEIFNESIRDEVDYSKAVIAYLKRTKPRFVGLATFVTDFEQSLSLAEFIKKETGITIIVGNAHPSICPQDFIFLGSPFDIAVMGEGEITLKEILDNGLDRLKLSKIHGISYLDDGKCLTTEKREIMDLKDCGMPAYHKIDTARYAKPTKYIIRRMPASCAVIYTGRGCPFKCGFCAANSVWNANSCPEGQSFVRKRPVEMVIRELEILEKKYGFDFFYIMDDTFGITENDVTEFCEAYRNSGLTMLWAAETRVNSSCFKNEHLLELMKNSGCLQLDFGVETGSPKLLKIIRKGITVDQIYKAFALCKKYRIRTFANILLNLPTETKEDILMTDTLLKEINPTFVSVGVTQPYPGTMFFEKYIKKPIGREDYKNLNRLLPSDDYRMAYHSVSLQKLLYYFQFKFGVYTPFEISVLKSDRRYWKKIVCSPRRFQYVYSFFRMMIAAPFVEYLQMYRNKRMAEKEDPMQ